MVLGLPYWVQVISTSKDHVGRMDAEHPTYSNFYCCIYRLWAGNSKEQKPTFQKGNSGTKRTKLGLDLPKPPRYDCGGGGSDSNLLVFPEERPLVRCTDVLEDPVHLVMLRLIGYGEHRAAAAGLPSVLHHLPDTQLLHLHKDELTPQRHCIWELLSEAQHDSALWEAALVVVILLQLCKERTVGSFLPAFATQVWDQAPCHRGKLWAQEKLLCCAKPPIGIHLPSDVKRQVMPP